MRTEPPELRVEDGTSILVEWSRNERAIELTSDGSVTVREVGGARFMAGLPEEESPPTRLWRSHDASSLHGRTLAALIELGFPDVPMLPPVPDERITYLTVRDRETGREGSVFVTHALVRHAPILAPLLAELEALIERIEQH